MHRFHTLRRWDHPPVFVIHGPPGSEKTSLLARLELGFRRRWAWRVGREVDVRLDIASSLNEAEGSLDDLRVALRRKSGWIRRVRTPRFTLMKARLHRLRGRNPQKTDSIDNDLAAALRAAGHVAEKTSGLPLSPISVFAKPIVAIRLLWLKWGPADASRWTREFVAELDAGTYGEKETKVARALERGLIDAMAADLAHATGRRLFPVDKIALFLDAHDSLPNVDGRYWPREFSQALSRRKARVMMVVSCRDHTAWTQRTESERSESYGDLFTTTGSVEIHTLKGLDEEERIYALAQYRVPADKVERLARFSRGHPQSLHLLGATFGASRPELDEIERQLTEKFPVEEDRITEEWVDRFTTAVCERLVLRLDPELARHARAAAVLRFFDRDLLRHVLGEDLFRDRRYDQLIAGPLVALWQPSPRGPEQLPKATYRVRDFARSILGRDAAEAGATKLWHERARDYFQARTKPGLPGSSTEESRRAAGVEWLYHQLAIDGEAGKGQLFRAVIEEMRSRRFDRCDSLLRLADDLPWADDEWSARRLMVAGKIYMASGDYPLAERRYRAAREIAPIEPGGMQVALSVAQSLAHCLRLQGRLDEARGLTRLISDHAKAVPVMRFQAIWTESLLDKAAGDLDNSARNAVTARAMLEQLMREDPRAHSEAAAEHGLGALSRKPIHLDRHEADLARLRGDYRRARELIASAQSGYEADKEEHMDAYTAIVESHLLRLEGRPDLALGRAQGAHRQFLRTPEDWRGDAQALRAIGQAQLANSDLPAARRSFEQLLLIDPRIYPTGHAVGHFGLGETHRREGDPYRAHAAYSRALESEVFERCYAVLGLAEMAHAEWQRKPAGDLLRGIRQGAAFRSRPLLVYWEALISSRLAHRAGDSSVTKDLARARGALERISWGSLEPGASIEREALTQVELASQEGLVLPAVALNLP